MANILLRVIHALGCMFHTESTTGDTATGMASISSVDAGGMVSVALAMGISVAVGTSSSSKLSVTMSATPTSTVGTDACRSSAPTRRVAFHRKINTEVMMTKHRAPIAPDAAYTATKPFPSGRGCSSGSAGTRGLQGFVNHCLREDHFYLRVVRTFLH